MNLEYRFKLKKCFDSLTVDKCKPVLPHSECSLKIENSFESSLGIVGIIHKVKDSFNSSP